MVPSERPHYLRAPSIVSHWGVMCWCGFTRIAVRWRGGWNQSELARRAGLRPAAISTYCRGKDVPSPESMTKLARVLGWTAIPQPVGG